VAGLVAMYLPVYWHAAVGPAALWQSEENGHGIIILAVLAWLFWSKRQALAESETRPAPVLGWSLFSLGLLVYLFGRVFGIASAEFISHLFIVPAALLLLKGRRALQVAWFPVLYLVFLIPLPGTVVDAMTGVLKHWISGIVETTLHAVGYPIARSGVMMTIGQYELLVADACSGLHSMFSLSALGTLYMYIVGRASRLHNAVMLVAILPIAFVANIVRVIILVLITFHFGDEAGQGFLHGAAGVVLMLVALVFFFAIDGLLNMVLAKPSDPGTRAASTQPQGGA
ncbi:MAG TPA: exosortase B, partial [Burkholderiaceae bacterium]|nr:exosortase B [Burkholderiaceae bacterium]